MVAAQGYPILRVGGVEADDVIGTLTRQAVEAGCEVVIVSTDKDFAQLVGPRVRMLDSFRDVSYDAELVRKKWGVPPERFVDFLALVGDKIDNIPGVPGIGAKGAAQLLESYANGESDPSIAKGRAGQTAPKVAFIFPGQGSQWFGMGKELFQKERVFREQLERCDQAIQRHAGWSLLATLNAPAADGRWEDVDFIQPALFSMQTALAALWPSDPVRWNAEFVWTLLFSSVLATAVGWWLWTYVLANSRAGVAGLNALGIPVVAVLSSAIQLGERPPGLELAGMTLIGIALALLAWLGMRRPY